MFKFFGGLFLNKFWEYFFKLFFFLFGMACFLACFFWLGGFVFEVETVFFACFLSSLA